MSDSETKEDIRQVVRKRTASSQTKYVSGDDVVVRSREEILATLDESGCLDGVPFMPEMLKFCGSRMRVYKRAHKTCDYVTSTGSIRQLADSVHLDGARCDGQSHGGCEARCLLFWKTAWVTPAGEEDAGVKATVVNTVAPCSVQNLADACREPRAETDAQSKYRCQATLLPTFTTPIGKWELGHYIEDYRSGNMRSLWSMIGPLFFRGYDNLVNLGIGLGAPLRAIYNAWRRLRGGVPFPVTRGAIPLGVATPTVSIGLTPGDWVRVKPHDEILKTMDAAGRNRGMYFSMEMVPYCGRTFKVLARVEKLIDEKTGKLITMKNPGIILDGVICRALYMKHLLFCPRATYPYWREIWLEKIDA